MRRFVQITPCENWFYVATGSDGGDIVERIAAWALTSDGKVVGLINDYLVTGQGAVAELVPASVNGGGEPGDYLHADDLSVEQQVIAGLRLSNS